MFCPPCGKIVFDRSYERTDKESEDYIALSKRLDEHGA